VDATVITSPETPYISYFQKAEALLHQNDQLKSEHATGIVLWEGTLLSRFARASEHHVLDQYRVDAAVSQMATMVKAVTAMGMPEPAVILIPKRPTEKLYIDLIKEHHPEATDHRIKRWWKNGSAFLNEATLLNGQWCGTTPQVIEVDYSNLDAAVAKIMKHLPSNVWDDYQNGKGLRLTDKEQFMGLSPMEVKVPKKYLSHIVYEAASKDITLDAHVTAIFKKYLLEDVRRPHTE
jgi:hypothetical protein